METVRIRRTGFPVRVAFQQIATLITEAKEKKAKADVKLRAKKALPKPRILYSISKGQGRKRKPKT